MALMYTTPTELQIKEYLKRIGFRGKPNTSFTTLKKLVENHIFTFPYEIIDVHSSKFDSSQRQRTNLSFNALFKKLVLQHRGGHCAELNVFLQTMLHALGFEVTPILAESLYHTEEIPVGQRPKHLAAIVTIENQKYVVDAAFGGLGMLSPIPLQEGEYHQFSEKFKFSLNEHYSFVFQCWRDKWINLFGFNPNVPATKAQYYKVNADIQEPLKKESTFQRMFLCTKPVKTIKGNQRIRIYNDDFIIYRHGKLVSQRKIINQTDLQNLLKNHFEIELKDYLRFTPEAMLANQNGIRRPPVLHQFNTRLRKKYEEITREQTPLNHPPEGHHLRSRFKQK